MGKIIDKVLLFIYSISAIILTGIGLVIAFEWIAEDLTTDIVRAIYSPSSEKVVTIVICSLIFLISIRFFYLSVRFNRERTGTIDQRNDFGDVRISIETVQNLSLKAASRIRGVKDLRARVKISDSGLDIQLRSIVDGETSIPQLTDEIQRNVKAYVEEITGIPVAYVTVFVANVVQTPTFKSRVE